MKGYTSARKVYLASAAPPVRFQNVYGIDMPTTRELIAHGQRDEEVVRRSIGADGLFYQQLDDLVASVAGAGAGPQRFDLSIFNGEYVTGGVSEDYLASLSARRMEQASERLGVAREGQLSLFDEQRGNVSPLGRARKLRAVGGGGRRGG